MRRAEEEVAPLLPPAKRAYVFGPLAGAAARFAVWMLPEIGTINRGGAARMCRMLAALQPALSSAGSGAGGGGGGPGAAAAAATRTEASRHFDRAKLYYTLLTYSPEGLVATAAEKPHRFTAPEYAALLAVTVPERPVSPEHRAALQRVLAEAARGPVKGGGSAAGGGAGAGGGGDPAGGGGGRAGASTLNSLVKAIK